MSEDQEIAIQVLKEKKLVKKGDQIIIIGERFHNNSRQPQMRIIQIDE